MSNDDSLLGFLKKKSLFNQSPTRNPNKRSRSKSRGKDSIIQKFNQKDMEREQPVYQLYPNTSHQQLRRDVMPQRTFPEKQYEPTFEDNNYRKDNSRSFQHQFSNPKIKSVEQNFDFTLQDRNNKFVNGFTNFALSFESARLESAQCLETLSLKLSTEISNVNYRIDQFRSNIVKVLNQQLKALREQILHLVDQAFKESQRSIKEFMKAEEEKQAGDLIKIKEILEKEYVKVETMKEEINQPQWRKVTGEILSSELEKNLEELIKKSSASQIGKWQMKNLSGQRLKNLDLQLRELVRLKS